MALLLNGCGLSSWACAAPIASSWACAAPLAPLGCGLWC